MIKFVKVREVETPLRAREGDAGYDFFLPIEFGNILIKPGQSLQIKAGLKLVLPEGTALVMLNKSSRGIQGLQVGAQVVDENYRGEISLNVWNISNKDILILEGEKVLQGVLIKYGCDEFQEIDETEYGIYKTSRGDRGFGSSGGVTL